MTKPEEFILAALRVQTLDSWLLENYTTFPRDTLYQTAARNMVEPMVAHRLMELPGLGEQEVSFWASIHQERQHYSTTMLNSIRHIAIRLATEGVPVILLKDTGLAMKAYPCPYCRKAEDVDLLVPEGSFEIIERVMEEEGFSLNLSDYYHRPRSFLLEVNGQMEFDRKVPVSAPTPASAPAPVAEADKMAGEAGGAREAANPEATEHQILQYQAVEFHVRPQAGSWIRRTQEGSAAELFSRAEWYTIGAGAKNGPQSNNHNSINAVMETRHAVPSWSSVVGDNQAVVGVLAPHDNLVHVAVHAAKHYFVLDRAIRMYVDMDRLIRNTPPNWDEFLKMAARHRMKQAISIALSIARDLLGTPVPPQVFEGLGSYRRTRWLIEPLIRRKGILESGEKMGHKLTGLERRLMYLLLNDTVADSIAAAMGTLFPSREKLQLRYSRLPFRSESEGHNGKNHRKPTDVSILTTTGHAARAVFRGKL